MMEKISSFKVDHRCLQPGIYVSRVDNVGGEIITTYDLRMIRVYINEPIDPAAMHTIEHIGATVLRNGPLKNDVIYFGPMGCMTGCYLILKGEHSIEEVRQTIIGVMCLISNWHLDIPGATKMECGNYTFHNLSLARNYAKDYARVLATNFHHDYPEKSPDFLDLFLNIQTI